MLVRISGVPEDFHDLLGLVAGLFLGQAGDDEYEFLAAVAAGATGVEHKSLDRVGEAAEN